MSHPDVRRHGAAVCLSLLVTAAAALQVPLATAAAATGLSIHVAGNKFVDGAGKTVQLRGVNLSGLEFTAIQGWSPSNPWGNTNVDFPGILKWHANVVRFPLNEASWQDRTCLDGAGKSHATDPGHNYKPTVVKSVDDATRAGLYVIIDLHLSAPANFCPMVQGPMANADNSLKFWTEVATQFKGYPNVMFELFNEPFMDWIAWGQDQWKVLRDGGNFTQFGTGTEGHWQANYDWKSVGMQQLLDTVRATGATNVVLVGSVSWSRDIRRWLEVRPKDPLNQMAAVWHAYPKGGQLGSVDATLPGFGVEDYDRAAAIVAAGIPLVITETGDHNVPGTKGAPFVSKLLPWADRNGVGYLGWTWNAWERRDDVLLKDNNGKPSDGYGEYFQKHLACMAAGTTPCP